MKNVLQPVLIWHFINLDLVKCLLGALSVSKAFFFITAAF